MTEKSDHLVDVRGLSIDFHTSYGLVQAVRNVSWHIDRGETLAILGESGSGKSVSASALIGLVDTPPGIYRSGTITFDGENLAEMSSARRRDISGRRIAMVFQDPLAALNPVYPVGWQIMETLTAHGVPKAEARTRMLELLRRLEIPEPDIRCKQYPHQFSGGQRQRIVIAMAIALRPDLLIADEPTSALDVTVQAEILKLLKELQQEMGMALLLITHDLGVALQMADRTVIMRHGSIVESGTMKDVLRNPQHDYTRELIAASVKRPSAPRAAGTDVLLEVNKLSKHFPSPSGVLRKDSRVAVKALDGVSFTLRKGETIGIVGESGSGKSTLGKLILRMDDATSGTVLYNGINVFRAQGVQSDRLHRDIQVVFQDPTASLNPRMRISEIISEPWEIHTDVLAHQRWRRRTGELLEQVGLQAGHMDRFPHQFSGGQRQRIAIARSLALQPDLIIFDEAVSALDVSIQAQVIELLKTLRETFGLSYLFIAHDLHVVRDFADRVLVMQNGKIVEQGPTAEIFENPQHPYTKKLLAATPEIDPELLHSASGN